MQTIPARLLTLKSGFPNLPETPKRSHVLLLGDEDVVALRARALMIRKRLAETGDLRAISALRDGSSPPRLGTHRLGVLGASVTELIDRLDLAVEKLALMPRERFQAKGSVFYGAPADVATSLSGSRRTPRTVFVFPGQGSQVEGMLDELCVVFPSVRAWIDDLDHELSDLPVVAPSVLAYPPKHQLSEDEAMAVAHERIELQGGAQLGVVANLALCELLVDVGVRPDLVVGHSNGEHAAVFTSGMLSLDRRGLLEVCRRFTEIALSMPPPSKAEAVAAVSLIARETLEAVVRRHGDLYLSMINCPMQFGIAGTADAVQSASATLASAGALVQKLPFRRAYHTPLCRAWTERLDTLYAKCDAVEARVPVYSCRTAAPFPTDIASFRRCAAEQLSQQIDFHATVERLYADGGRRFVEVGPGNALTGFVGDTLRTRPHLAIPIARAGQPALLDFERALARLFVDAVDLDFSSRTWRLLEAAGLAAVVVPHAERTAPIEVRPDAAATPRNVSASPQAVAQQSSAFEAEVVRRHFEMMNEFLAGQARMINLLLTGSAQQPLVEQSAPGTEHGAVIRTERPGTETRRRFTLEHDPLLREHSLGPHLPNPPPGSAPLAVIPFTFSMAVAAEAALHLFGAGVVTEMRDIRGFRWLALDRGVLDLAIQAEPQATAPSVAYIRLYDLAGGGRALAFEAHVEVASRFAQRSAPPEGARTVPAGSGTWTPAQFYRDFAFHGPAFQSVRSVEGLDDERLVAQLEVPRRPSGGDGSGAMQLDPGLLDSAGQLVGLWLLEQGKAHFGIFPFHLRRFEQLRAAPEPGATLHADAHCRWVAPGVTEADIEYFDAAGPIYRLSGFGQRYMQLPVSLVATLMGGWSADPENVLRRERYVSVAGASPFECVIDLPQGLLDESWGIWRRALAHHVLAPGELAEWYDAQRQDTVWLLGRMAAKEAVRRGFIDQGLRLESFDLGVTGPAVGKLIVMGSRLQAPVTVEVQRLDGATVARLHRDHPRMDRSGSVAGPTLTHAGSVAV